MTETAPDRASPTTEPARPRARALRALDHVEYRKVFTAALVVQLGFWFSHIAFQGLMVELTDNDELQITLLFFALFIPILFVAPIGGLVADRLDRKAILLACYAALAAGSSVTAVLVTTDVITPALLLLMAFVVGVVFSFLSPAMHAVAANSVPAYDLPSAVSLTAIVVNVTRVAGPILAAPIVAAGVFAVGWVAYGVAALLAFLLMSGVRLTPYQPEADALGPVSRMRAGFAHARERRPAASALLLVAVLSLCLVSHIGLLPSFVEDDLGQSRGRFAYVVAASGVGAIIGAFVAGSLERAPTIRRGALFGIGYAASLLAFGLTSRFWLALLIQVVAGLFYFATFTTLQTIVQSVVDEDKRGRVMSLFQISWAGLVPFGALAMGIAAGPLGLGVRPTIVGAAVIALVYSISVAVRSKNWPGADAYQAVRS